MGVWQCAPTSYGERAGSQVVVITEVRVVLARCKDNVFFFSRRTTKQGGRMPNMVVQFVFRDFSVAQ